MSEETLDEMTKEIEEMKEHLKIMTEVVQQHHLTLLGLGDAILLLNKYTVKDTKKYISDSE